MTTYIALLHGINIGGKNIIKMADLKTVLEATGLENVQTYIQSGNVLFQSDESEWPLRLKLQDAIKKAFNYNAKVVLRTARQFEKLTCDCPFTAEEVSKAQSLNQFESLYICFFPDVLNLNDIEMLNPYVSDLDKYKVIGRDVYLLLSHSIRDSKLAGCLQKMDFSTVRNFKTVLKLNEMVKATK